MKYSVGDYFGELALLNDEPRAASVLATSECKTVSIDGESFKVTKFFNFYHILKLKFKYIL